MIEENFDVSNADKAEADSLYSYAQDLYYGTGGYAKDVDRARYIFSLLFEYFLNNEKFLFDYETNSYICPEGSAYKDIFLCAEYYTTDDCGITDMLLNVAKMIQDGIPDMLEADPKRAFNLVKNIPQYPFMCGGMDLVEMIRVKDEAHLFLADCYMYGKGTTQDLPGALSEYLDYRNDHLAQKRLSNLITDELDKLYVMFKESKEDDPLIYIALAVMTAEGIGCIPNAEAAFKYYVKAKDLYDNKYSIHYGLDEFNGLFGFNLEHFFRLLSRNANTVPYAEDIVLRPGDHVYLGRYNNRAVSWRVLDVEAGKALLLSDEVLESSYIVGASCMDGDWLDGITYLVDFADADFDYIYDAEAGTGECFLLSEGSFYGYLPKTEDRLCYYREQAYANTTDNEELNPNKLADWWIVSNGDEDSDVRSVVGEDGNVYYTNYRRDCGIRPAIYVPVKNWEGDQ